MPLELKTISMIDRPILENLFQYYLYDMSEFSGWPISFDGTFTYPTDLLSPYWEKEDSYPYFIISENEIAGFSLVRRSPECDAIWDMGQFFVLRKFRGGGLGRWSFFSSVNKHPGQWQVRVLPENKRAYCFWETCIGQISDGAVQEETRAYNGQNMTYFSFNRILGLV